MTLSIPRTAIASMAGAALLSLSLFSGAAAQVATLANPDESPAPDAEAEAVLEFEDREEAVLAFAECMRDNGIAMDDPAAGTDGGRGFLRGGPGGGDAAFDRFSQEFRVAQEACGTILEAARPEVDLAAEQERLEDELAFAQCFRDSGYPEYPDPAVDTDGRLQRGGQQFQELGIDRRSEEFQNVRIACAEQLGFEATGRGPGGAAGPGGAVPAGGDR